jgi:hypothetical protein
MMGCASVTVSPPWPTSKAKVRALCSECWRNMTQYIDDQEYVRDNYDLPIDWLSNQYKVDPTQGLPNA